MAARNTVAGSSEAGAATLVGAGAGTTVSLPQGFPLAEAAFSRAGADLVVSAPGRAPVVVRDFFTGEAPPSLATADGAYLPGTLAAKLAAAGAAGQLAAAGTTPGIESIGRIETVSGQAFAVRADGARVELAVGSRLYDGDILETGADGAVGVVLADETSLSMGPEGRMVLDEMIYDPGTQDGKMSISVVKGIYTIVSGIVSKTDPDAMVIHTPVGSIGIRGTQMGLDIADGRNLNIVMMQEGDGYVGELFVRNAAGLQVMNQANQVVFIGGVDRAPAFLAPVDNAGVARMFETTLTYLPKVSGRENDYGNQGPQQIDRLETFETQAGRGGVEGTGGLDETIRVVEGDYTKPRQAETAALAVAATPEPDATTPAQPVARDEPAAATTTAAASATNESPLAFDTDLTTREDQSVSGQLTAFDPDNDALSYTLTETGAPQHGTVTLNADGTYTYTPEQDFSGTDRFTYLVSDGRGGTTVATATVAISPVADAPVMDVAPAAGAEDLAIPLAIAADVPGSEDLASVTIADVPTGATLSAGTDNGDGTWTLAGDDLDQLGSLSVTPPANSSRDFTLQVTATSTDGGVTTASVPVAVAAVADQPVLQTADATVDTGGLATNDRLTGTAQADTLVGGGGADTLIGGGGADVLYGDTNLIGALTVPVDIQASLGADVDGSESLGLTVAGVPEGGALSAGTDLGGGAWSLAPDQLEGLNMTLPEGYNDDFQLQVTANAVDTDFDSGATDTASAGAPINYTFTGGEPGDDLLRGGGGDDVLYGGAGSDDLSGGGGDDVLYGGAGSDDLSGDAGADVLYGEAGDDALAGGGGADVLYGGADNDVLTGGFGTDTLYGGEGDDALGGGGDADALYGGAGDDVLRGDGGNDVLSGGAGDDTLIGGAGTGDSFVFQSDSGHDIVDDYRAGETLRFEGPEFSPDNVTFTQDGSDVRIAFADQPDISVTVNDVDLSQGYQITPDPDAPAVVVTFRDSA